MALQTIRKVDVVVFTAAKLPDGSVQITTQDENTTTLTAAEMDALVQWWQRGGP